MTSIDDLRRRADQQQQRYAFSFAGHPRITRNPDLLQAIITDLSAVRTDAAAAGASDLVTQIDRSLESYNTELARIREAKKDGPLAMAASRAMTWAQFAMNRYRRNFAGHSRSDRDLGLLREILSDTEAIEADMARIRGARPADNALASTHDSTRRNLDMYRAEVRTIRDVQNAGGLTDRAIRFATLANGQFELYRFHFAGKPRNSRSPALLERMLGNLEDYLGGLRSLKLQGMTDPTNDKNIKVIEDNMARWREELGRVREVVRNLSAMDRGGSLGAAANERFTEYRENFAGKSRATRDLGLLNRLIEDLIHIAKGMDAVDRDDGDDRNADNLQIVLDRIRTYEREYGLVQQAQKDGAS